MSSPPPPRRDSEKSGNVSSAATLACTSPVSQPEKYDVEAAQKVDRAPISWKRLLPWLEPKEISVVEETFTRQLEHCERGYPRVAGFLSSEDNFSVYRGFRYLHSRTLLNLQDKIVALERELDNKDRIDAHNIGRRGLKSRTRDEIDARKSGDQRPRDKILEEIRLKLLEYDELLVKARDIASFQRPSNRDYRSVRHWFNNEKPLVEKEQEFVKHREDVITLHNGREWSGFDGLVENLLLRFDCRLIRYIFMTPELRSKTTNEDVHYYCRSRVDIFVGLVITAIIFVLLILPVIAMYTLTSYGPNPSQTFKAIGVLIVFTLLFSAAMSLLTKSRRHELFAASATYCAVLVVFISNFNG